MWLRTAAFAVLAIVPCAQAQVTTRPDVMTLDDAVARVANTHPDLRLADGRRTILYARQEAAGYKPATVLGATLENAFGSGPLRGLDQAELTVTLSGVLERGGKLDARRVLAQANIDAAGPQREITRLDLLAETARRYLAITAAEQRGDIARTDMEQRQRAVDAARKRLQAGASPESVLFGAQAWLAQAELDRDRALQEAQAARQHLAALWNERSPGFTTVSGNPLHLPPLQDFSALATLLERTPELSQLAGEARVREAQLRLAQSQSSADLDWSLGARTIRGGGTGLVAGLSVPLGSARRNGAELRMADANLALLGVEREALQSQLYSTLADAHGRYRTAQVEVSRMAKDVLPALARAEKSAGIAWRAGAISYMDWAQLQAQRIEARNRQLDAALRAQTALIEIQRLSGQTTTLVDASPVQEPGA